MNAIRIGKKIRCARTMKGMSQDDLAEKVGRHRPAISRLEAAAEQAPRLTAELIEDLCRELDMDPWAFFDNSNRGTPRQDLHALSVPWIRADHRHSQRMHQGYPSRWAGHGHRRRVTCCPSWETGNETG